MITETGRDDRFWSDSQINTPFLLVLYCPSGHEQLYPPGKLVQIIPSGHPCFPGPHSSISAGDEANIYIEVGPNKDKQNSDNDFCYLFIYKFEYPMQVLRY